MLKNYLLITLRGLAKNKLFIFINVLGMGVALACCIVAYLNWDFYVSWDKSQKNASEIYRVQFWREFQGRSERFGLVPMPLPGYVRQNVGGVAQVVRYQSSYTDVRIGEEVFGTQTAFVDSGFFRMFTYEFLHGRPEDLADKTRVFISDEEALKFYKRTDVVGEAYTQIVLGADGVRRPKEFIVGGVFRRLPLNTSLFPQTIMLFDNYWDIVTDPNINENNWGRWVSVLFLRIPDATQVPQIEQQLQAYVEPQNRAREDFKIARYYLSRYEGMMASNRTAPQLQSDGLGGGIPQEAVTVPAVMAGLLLLLACFNFTNTSVAISSRRLKEIGIRKVMGGLRYQLIAQFLGENLFVCFLGLLAGLLLAELLVPAYDSLWPWLQLTLSYSENAGFLLFLVLLLLITAVIAGAYPSLYVTSFEPVSILKGTARFGETSFFSRFLLGGQFVISLLSLIFGISFYLNGRYQEDFDLGFRTRGVISTWVGSESGFTSYRAALSDNPDIQLIAGTNHHVANSFYNDPVKFEDLEREVDIMDVGDNYLEVMEMQLVAGRAFERDSESDRKESIIVTEKFVEEFGWKDGAIGKRIVWMDTVSLYVVGVVRNIYSRSVWEPIQPMMIRYTAPARYRQLLVKCDPMKANEVDAYMERKWKEVFPNSQYFGLRIERDIAEALEINRNVVLMFGFLGGFALLMTGIGLYSLVSLNIVRRMKEIGVRKVLGASVAQITTTVNRGFIFNLAISLVLGSVLGFLAANWLMNQIWEYYLSVGALTLVIAAVLISAVAVAATGYKTVSAAQLNPTKTLRDE